MLAFSEEEEEASGYDPPTYDGGEWATFGVVETNGGDDYAVVTAGWGASPETGGVWDPLGPMIGAEGYAACFGEITCTIYWTGLDSPPPVVVIKETSIAQWSGDNGSADNGLGVDAEESEGGGTAHSVRWSVQTQNTHTIQVAVEPEADVVSDDIGGGVCSVQYKVEVFIPKLGFSGVLNPLDAASILIGQQLTASVELPEELESSQNTFTGWTISSGRPFADYQPTTYYATFTPWTAPTGSSPSIQVYFAEPGATDGRATLSVNVSIPERSLWFQLSRAVSIAAPDVRSLTLITPSGRARLMEPLNQENLSHPKISRLFHIHPSAPENGVTLRGQVVTPSDFVVGGDTGTWCFTQLVTRTKRFMRKYNTAEPAGDFLWANSANFETGNAILDHAFPYRTYKGEETQFHTFSATIEEVRDAVDSPGFAADSQSFTSQLIHRVESNDAFRMYLLYLPPGAESEWVPLRSLNWDWLGKAHDDSHGVGNWSMDADDAPSVDATADHFPEHPQWTTVVTPFPQWVLVNENQLGENAMLSTHVSPSVIGLALFASVGLAPSGYSQPIPPDVRSLSGGVRPSPEREAELKPLRIQIAAQAKVGRQLFASGRYQEALDVAETWLQIAASAGRDLATNWADAKAFIAEVAIRNGEFAAALTDLNHALAAYDAFFGRPESSLDPGISAWAYRMRVGWLKAKLGDLEQSRAMWTPWTGPSDWVGVLPNQSGNQAGLEAMWLTRIALSCDEAKDRLYYYTLAHQKAPNNPFVNDRLGSLLNIEARKLQDVPEKLNERIALYKRAYDHHIAAARNAPNEELRLEFGRNATGPRIRMETLIKQRDGG